MPGPYRLLGALLAPLDLPPSQAAVPIRGITERHDRVVTGGLFSVVRGRSHDGAAFAIEAARRGAAVLLTERTLPVEIPQVVVAEVRPVHAVACQRFWGDPSRHLDCVGVTGTDGKTSTCYAVRDLLGEPGERIGLISTTEIDDGRTRRPAVYTTPPAEDLAHELATMRDCGCRRAVIELSSQAMAQHRADGVRLAAAGWTTFARDHLDQHGDEAGYFAAKAHILTLLHGRGVLRTHRPIASRLTDPRVRTADLPVGLAAAIASHTPVPFERENLTIAAAIACDLGVADATLVDRLRRVRRPPGRLERVPTPPSCPRVIVDYAHTPHALQRAVAAVGNDVAGPVTVVVGAGGDRDPGKRLLMGAAVSAATRVILTADNPRSERVEEICRAIAEGVTTDCTTIPNRAAAVAAAIAQTPHDGVVLIAGKGHETSQTIGSRTVAMDDRELAATAIAGRSGAS